MKTSAAIILAITAAATAAPTVLEARAVCKPATYSCALNPTTHGQGWQVCDTQGNWVVSHSSSHILCGNPAADN